MTTTLVLSGGGTKGSFEIGALQYLYDNGFFAPVICSTSVGSVNAIQLAHGGTVDSQKAAFEKLKTIWKTELRFNTDMYEEAPWLKNVSPRTRATIRDLFLGGDIDYPRIARDVIFFPPYALAQAVALGVDVGRAIDAVKNASSIFTLDPIRTKIVQKLNRAAVAGSGVELRMVAVSLDSGAIRYITQDGRVLETDGSPVPGPNPDTQCTAEWAAYNAALDARNITLQVIREGRRGQPVPEDFDPQVELARANIALENARNRLNECRAGCPAERAAYNAALDARNITLQVIREGRRGQPVPEDFDPQVELARANTALENARNRLNECIGAVLEVDVVDGVIASSSIPGAFPPVMLGDEVYVDGGIRWVLPLKAAFDFDTESIVAINASPAGVPPARRIYRGANLLEIGERVVLEIMLSEIQERHLEVVKSQAFQQRRKVWVITPRVEVHDTLTIDRGLIDINIAYGWMRAADVMTAFPFTAVGILTPVEVGASTTDAVMSWPGEPSPEQPPNLDPGDIVIERPAQPTEGLFVEEASDSASASLADAITRCRRYCWEVEHKAFSPEVPRNKTPDPYALDEVRLYKTLLGLLVDARREVNGKLPPDSATWADNWELHWWDPADVPGVGNTPWNEFNGAAGMRPAEARQTTLVVKAPDKDEIYLLSPLKHWITSPAALEQVLPEIGFAGVKVIPDEYIDAFPRGEDIIAVG